MNDKWAKIGAGFALMAVAGIFPYGSSYQIFIVVLGACIVLYATLLSKSKYRQVKEYLANEIKTGTALIETDITKEQGIAWHEKVARNLAMAMYSIKIKDDSIPGGEISIPDDFSLTKHQFNSAFEEVTTKTAIQAGVGFLEWFHAKISPHQIRDSFEESDLEK